MAESVIHLANQHITSKIKQGSSKSLTKIKFEVEELLSELKGDNVNELNGKELNKSYEVRNGIGELNRIAYAAEDEVDILVSTSSPLSLFGFGISRVSKKLRKLNKRAKEVNGKLQQHSMGSDESRPRARGSQEPKGHLPSHGNLVIGIQHDITKLVDQLTGKLKSNDSRPPVDKLAIVGMGGSGKTTLARSIYNHKSIKKHFHFQAWVSVTKGWDTSVVLRSIHKQVQGKKWWFFRFRDNDEVLQYQPRKLVSWLSKVMNKKTCLLVLDDVWDVQPFNDFIALIQKDDVDCCKYTIIITSRQSPLNHDKWLIHEPQRLTEADSWKLLSSVGSRSSKALTEEYHPLAKEMLRKCEGLPLPIIALGMLLKTMETKGEWQRVLTQITGTDATSMYGPVSEILGLSYDELPNYLKPCFLYLALFPQGSTISGGQLIRMWIAEGFITSKVNDEETVEEAGRRYLQELVDHTMVDVVSKTYTGKVKSIRLHDIMRDCCLSKAKEIDFLTVSSSWPDATAKTSRRAAINNLSSSSSIILSGDNLNLRSLAILGNSGNSSAASERYTSQVNQRLLDLDQLCRMYKLLRVLDISGIKSLNGTLPGEIGNLIHLTYLRIRTTNIRQLPKSIGKLRNLLTLDYRNVSVDKEINVPNVLWKLEKLRHLYLPNEMSGMMEELKLDTLKDLITLWGVGGGRWMLDEMNTLSSTLSNLYIHRISTEDQFEAVLSCPSIDKNACLSALALDWYSFEFKNVDKLLANQNLRKLRLMGKAPDESHPDGLPFPSNLVKLELCYTQLRKPETMELLGRSPVLKVLNLSKDSYIGSEWSCRKGSFPVLEELKLDNLRKLENWEMEEGAMPCLKKLTIVSCINLQRMPKGLKLVQRLENLDIKNMTYKFRNRLQEVKWWKKGGGEDVHIIKHIRQVTIRDSSAQLFNESKIFEASGADFLRTSFFCLFIVLLYTLLNLCI